ncbi:MAG TPA: hypothetical protein VEW93_02820 [Acidimicrobiales bacterium]|nr:hypothetical protein [Acidimicrobiales bacterium]
MVADPPPSSPGPRPAPAPVGAVATSAHLGASLWWCEELFAVVGAWVPSVPEAPARAHLAELSRVLGEVADQLAAHLARPSPIEARAWVVAPSAAAPRVVEALAAPEATLDRLAGVHRVLVPRLLVAWAALVAEPGEGTGRALVRAVRRARGDVGELGEEGEALVQAHVAVADDGARRAGHHVGVVEGALVAAGGLVPVGPGALPSPADPV